MVRQKSCIQTGSNLGEIAPRKRKKQRYRERFSAKKDSLQEVGFKNYF